MTGMYSMNMSSINNLCLLKFHIFSFEKPGSTLPSYTVVCLKLILNCLSSGIDSLQLDIIKLQIPFDSLPRTDVNFANKILWLRQISNTERVLVMSRAMQEVQR